MLVMLLMLTWWPPPHSRLLSARYCLTRTLISSSTSSGVSYATWIEHTSHIARERPAGAGREGGARQLRGR